MSKNRVIKAVYKSESALRQALEDACAEFGIVYEYHPEAVNLNGDRGDVRAEKANYIIRRKYLGSAANDMGFEKQADGSFDMIASDFDMGKGGYAGGSKNAKIAFVEWRYQYNQVQEYAWQNGFTVSEVETADGCVELALERAW